MPSSALSLSVFCRPSYLVPPTSAFLLQQQSTLSHTLRTRQPISISSFYPLKHTSTKADAMDAVDSTTSPYSPPSLRHKLRTTVCGCFGSPSSPGSAGERPQSGGRARWRRRVAAAGEFRYDPLSYALNFDDGGSDDGAEAEDAAFRYRNFNSRLPPSPPAPASRAVAIA
ncbi:uncharacterized protein [Aegilops tauschii subsp. strangulata]|nr:uncharacterized protein LOC109754235 [Aegilops tauschii subsp. strangulata]